MIQIHVNKVTRLFKQGLAAKDIAAQFYGRYSVKDINAFKPAEKVQEKEPEVVEAKPEPVADITPEPVAKKRVRKRA